MPIRSEGKRRWVEVARRFRGSRAQAWRAMATGPGYTSWFVPTTIEEKEGGALEFDFGGGMVQKGVVTTFQPEERLVYEEHEWSGDAPPVITEITVSAASGDTCVIRMTHSLFTDSDQWDNELESFEAGWANWFDILDLYQRDFADQPAAIASAGAMTQSAPMPAWRAFAARLGLTGVLVGDAWSAPSDGPPLAGTIEQVQMHHKGAITLVRLAEPAPGILALIAFSVGPMTRIATSTFFYGDGAATSAEQGTAAWTAYLAKHYTA